MNKEALIGQKRKLSGYLKEDPENDQLTYQLIDINLQLGLYEEALSILDNSSVQQKNISLSLFKKSNILLALGRASEAIEVLKSIKITDEIKEPVNLNLAHAYFQISSFERANSILSELNTFTLPSTYILQGRIYHYLGKLDSAIVTLTKAKQLYPDDSEITGLLALLLFDKGVYDDKTFEYAEAALAINPNQIEGLLTAGMMEQQLTKDFIKAENYFDKAIEKHPEVGRGWLYKGLVVMLNNDFERAKTYLMKACELMPDHIGSWHSLGWSYILLDDINAAEQCFENALKLDRNFSETHGGLSVIEAMQGHNKKAQILVKKALRLNPDCLSAQYALLILEKAKNNPEQMHKILQNVFQSQSGKDAQDIIKIMQGNKRI